MIISFIPQQNDAALIVSKAGDVLIINGDAFDLSSLPDGGTIPAGSIPCPWILGPVERIDGDLRLTLILPHGPDPEPWQAYPDPLIDPADGALDLPVDTTVTVTETKVEGGTNVTTTTSRRHQPAEVQTVFMPDLPAQEETANVDA